MKWLLLLQWLDEGDWVLIVIGVLLTIFWVVQLLRLMNMSGEEFCWQYDKALWFVIVFFGYALGAFVFWVWRKWRQTEASVARELRANAISRRGKQLDTQDDE